MRRTIFALAVISLAPTAVMASTSGRELVKGSEFGTTAAAVAKDVPPEGVAGSSHGGRNIILAKGDKSGTGPGAGGHKGQKKGERKGKQPHDNEGGGSKGGPKR
jgi:hypothetical protein